MGSAPKLPRDFKKLMSLLTKANLQGRRHAIVFDYSGGRTESSRELTDPEIMRLIRDLEKGFKELDRADKMRKKIISQAHEMGWELPSGKIDMDMINAWCVKYGFKHKPLNSYSYKELPVLVTQFDNMYNDYLKAI